MALKGSENLKKTVVWGDTNETEPQLTDTSHLIWNSLTGSAAKAKQSLDRLFY